MELALGRPGECFQSLRSRVSILVFVELALGLAEATALGGLLECFNPCFRGTCPRTLTGTRLGAGWRVSILVFVELALGQRRLFRSASGRTRFNPCFRGTCPRTRCCPAENSCQDLVSILVFVELALGLRSRRTKGSSRLCFNPCFRGTCPRTMI